MIINKFFQKVDRPKLYSSQLDEKLEAVKGRGQGR